MNWIDECLEQGRMVDEEALDCGGDSVSFDCRVNGYQTGHFKIFNFAAMKLSKV